MLDRNLTVTLVVGTAVVGLAWGGYRAHAADRAMPASLEVRLDGLTAGPAADPARTENERSQTDLDAGLQELKDRLAQLEITARRSAVEDPAAGEREEPGPERGEASASEDGPDEALRLEFEGLLTELVGSNWDFSGSREDYERFLKLARETGLLDERILDLEERVAAGPYDTETRMELADAYIGKVMTVAGPEQGLWGGRAEEQWLAVAELDDEHWRSHASLGMNYSYYPEVMGKTEDAIAFLEEARAIQRNIEPAEKHVQVYLFLARMHERANQREAAREVLVEGLQLHPGNAELEAALARIE